MVNAFDLDGKFLARIASPGGVLNAPWGTALAHPNFGAFGGDLLIGNFGDGRINAFHENADGTWTNSGMLKTTTGQPLSISGLWALQFGKGNAASGARQPPLLHRRPVRRDPGRGRPHHARTRGRRLGHRPGDAVADDGRRRRRSARSRRASTKDYTASTTANVISSAR